MILNKDNKFTLKAGDILRFPESDYTVISLHPGFYRNTLSLTIQINRTGQWIYCTPSSGFYGAEVIRKEN